MTGRITRRKAQRPGKPRRRSRDRAPNPAPQIPAVSPSHAGPRAARCQAGRPLSPVAARLRVRSLALSRNVTEAVRNVTEANSNDSGATPILAAQADYLIGVAGRAPSLHNTQPWHFTVNDDAIELYADASRRLHVDPDGREMIISCGAALYGLRLAVRSLGYVPEVELLRGPSGPRALARVRPGRPVPMTSEERKLLHAVPHRHTHRGPFEPGPLPAGLVGRLRADAQAEGATLTEIERTGS